MVRELPQHSSFLMTWDVLEVREDCLTAQTEALESTTVVTVKMLVSFVLQELKVFKTIDHHLLALNILYFSLQ